jgi:hypothetical protein
MTVLEAFQALADAEEALYATLVHEFPVGSYVEVSRQVGKPMLARVCGHDPRVSARAPRAVIKVENMDTLGRHQVNVLQTPLKKVTPSFGTPPGDRPF